MKNLLLIIFLLLPFTGFSQSDDICKTDTVELTFAYEFLGQDRYYKWPDEPRLVEFNGDQLTLSDYEHGTYLFFNPIIGDKCVPKLNSIEEYENKKIFEYTTTKIFEINNQAFEDFILVTDSEGRGSVGKTNERMFKWKIVRAKIVVRSMGILEQTVCNFEKKVEKDPYDAVFKAPAYYIVAVLSVQPVN